MWRFSRPVGTRLVLLSIFLFSRPAYAKYGGGSGTADDPYQIATAADLLLLGDSPEDYDKHFILTADIDLDPNRPDGKVFDKAIIAPDADPNDKYSYFHGTSFAGVFDGSGHRISHLTIHGKDCIGLFGQLASGAEVKNLGIVDVRVTGSGQCVAALVGYNWGKVIGCYSTGWVSGNSSVGGVVGWNLWGGSVSQCYSTGTVSGEWIVGGLVGSNDGTVTQCYGTGSVSGESNVGGLLGSNSGSIATTYSTGSVSGDWGVGGVVGRNQGHWGAISWAGKISNCYSTGTVSAHEMVGGVVGYGSPQDVTDSLWDSETSAQAQSAGGTGKTTAEMQTASAFLEAGWDFVNVWGIGENQTYPYLRKYSGADINRDASVNFLDLAALAENWLTDVSDR